MAASTTLNIILRGSPKTASTSRANAIAFIPGMTVSRVEMTDKAALHSQAPSGAGFALILILR
jgi:hypothetical protein